MIKSIALLRKKAGLSREEFIDYYENRHSVLIMSLLPGIKKYQRNFVDLEGAFLFPGANPVDFDSITEMEFADRTAYDAFVTQATQPETARLIAEDEENVFDRSATRMFLVDVGESHLD